MFSSFKVLRRKTAEDRKKDNRKSSSKWGLERALCQRSVDRVVDDTATTVDETAGDDDQHCRLRGERGDISSSGLTEVHEDWQEYHSNGSDAITTRIVGVPLERDPVHGLGINLRPSGGQGPLVVTYVKPYGPADREGTIKVGDRLLAVDGIRLLGLSPSDSRDVLMNAGTDRRPVWLTVEYDVSIMSSLRSVGRLLVEIESGPSDELRAQLGLSLIDSPSQEVVISRVRVASLAERCGAFQPGDRILAVNEYRIDENGHHFTARDVAKILEQTKSTLIQIEILPLAACSDEALQQIHRCPSPYYEPNSYEDFVENLRSSKYQEYPIESELLASTPRIRVETGMVTLQLAPGQDYGLAYTSAPSKMGVTVCYVESSSAAGRSGVLQVGDRLLTANGRQISEGLTRLEDLGTTIHLTVQFDVEIWPLGGGGAKGTPKDVTLTRSDGSGFGVTITDSGEDGILVSNVKWGSVAHRCGRIRVGDRVVGIDDTRVQDMNTAMDVFRTCGLTVTFHLISGNCDLGYSSPGLPSVDSAVESWDSGIEPAHHQLYSTCYPAENDDLREIHDFRLENDQSVDHSVTVTVQSDDDETCSSSRRLSQDALESPDNLRKNPAHFFLVNGQLEPPPSPPCPLKTNYKSRKVNLPIHWRGSSLNTSGLEAMEGSKISDSVTDSHQTTSFSTFRGPPPGDVDKDRDRSEQQVGQIFQVTLFKSVVFDDFGFSVSDGLYEKGVFVNTIKSGSPADLSNCLRPYDKIIQVNEVSTHDLDCCMTVPLMAAAGKKLTLTILRYNASNHPHRKVAYRPEDLVKPYQQELRPPSETSVCKTETL